MPSDSARPDSERLRVLEQATLQFGSRGGRISVRHIAAAVGMPPGLRARPFRAAPPGSLNRPLTWFGRDGDPAETVAHDRYAAFRASKPTPMEPRTL